MNSFGVELSSGEVSYTELLVGLNVSQVFICPHRFLSGVGVQVSTEGKTLSCFVTIIITRHSDKTKIAEKMFDMSRNQQGVLNVTFKPQASSQGQSYCVTVAESECGLTNSVSLLMAQNNSYEGVLTSNAKTHKDREKIPSGTKMFLRLYFGDSPQIVTAFNRQVGIDSAAHITPKPIAQDGQSTVVQVDSDAKDKFGNLEKRTIRIPDGRNLSVRISNNDTVFVLVSDEDGGTLKKTKRRA